MSAAGISGFGLHFPRPRVRLEDWCAWRGRDPASVIPRVGRAFRLRGPREDACTMAASAVLRLILDHGVDPCRTGMLAMGTESSTDNSASGAVIVKSMVDEALSRHGLPRIPRACEVPEVKQACLGGIYALKTAVRYVQTDGADRVAIVVASDAAEYRLGTVGEETQGAGACAMLVEPSARLVEVDLATAGSSAAFRGPDFRKPHRRLVDGRFGPVHGGLRVPDHPVVNGRYSTVCYVDEVLRAVAAMTARLGIAPLALYREVEAVFMHRPYARMPANALSALYLWAMRFDPDPGYMEDLAGLCDAAGVELAAVVSEMESEPDLYADCCSGRRADDAYPAAMALARRYRDHPRFREVVSSKLSLGEAAMAEVGNLYTASLPAWIAAGLEEAARGGRDLAGRRLLAIGYGSGNAAEALLLRVADGWRGAALRTRFAAALARPIDLDRGRYEALHAGLPVPGLQDHPEEGFAISHVGARLGDPDSGPDDLGVETYRYRPPGAET